MPSYPGGRHRVPEGVSSLPDVLDLGRRPAELRLRRGLERDGDDARTQWESWMAEEENYRATEHPRERADFVVRGDRGLWS
jgi:hypothetical protein